MEVFSPQDCRPCENGETLLGKILVLVPEAAREYGGGQLFFCVNNSTAGSSSIPYIPAWSLQTGELEYLKKRHIQGTLPPSRLPENARMQLSQIRPVDAESANGPFYTGCCFLPDGRYTAGVLLRGWETALAYARLQAPCQHTVRVFDENGMCVLEVMHEKEDQPQPPDVP